ncbi:hypothetical protein AGMMS49938_13940 [Fibrobacterales bacterium]|nr:hypothetical protein AGMMS49938_13940 [Fibrobacterales bacterium]
MRVLKFAIPAALVLAFSAYAEIAKDGDFENTDPPQRNKPAFITVITDPPNSDVFLDGEDLGKSPVSKKAVMSGAFRKLIILDQGKELVNVKVHVWPGDDKRNVIEDIKTVMPAGVIVVTTNPSKCRVTLNHDDADRTDGGPLTLNSVDAGSHVVGAYGCGGKTEILAEVKGEQTTEIYLDVKNPKKNKAVVKAGKIKKDEEE